MTQANLFELCCIIGPIFLASNIWFYVRVLRPIQQLSYQAAQLKAGRLDPFDQTFGGIPEIRHLQRAMAGMCGHVRRAQKETHSYHTALIAGQEAERTRIARELHDDTVQSLIAIAQSIELGLNWIETRTASAVETLKSARTQAVESVENLRRLIGNLRPPALEELGLIPALRILAKDIHGITMDIVAEGVERRLDEAQELVLFRCAQEAVHNALKHGKAQHVHIEVSYSPAEVRLTVRDKGVGFGVPGSLNGLVELEHYGLIGLVERIESLNGQARIISTPNQGTTIMMSLPLLRTLQPGEIVRDPVCRAEIHPHQAYDSVIYNGEHYYFCCPVCQGTFLRSPENYVVS